MTETPRTASTGETQRTIHELLKARFASARLELERAWDRLADADLSWSPGEGMRTIAGQLLEIANKEKETLGWIQQGVWPDEDPDAFAIPSASVEDIRRVMTALRVQTYAYIDSLSETELEQLVPNPNLWYEALRISGCPISEVLRSIARHKSYHTGQFYIYLWMRGDNPDSW